MWKLEEIVRELLEKILEKLKYYDIKIGRKLEKIADSSRELN